MLLNKYLNILFYYKKIVEKEIFANHNILLDYLTWENKIFHQLYYQNNLYYKGLGNL
ncbi:hypothetical protein C1645_747560 [Glomus cerebriforme]|uniref:Uncharacterized protein n=1 Tax=Glomus cerebriforme TaxID=658196 RepID=A0A397TME3_9GLOM|nr:hypothetical protein C1645_747560 [Glomus cerebriforme]